MSQSPFQVMRGTVVHGSISCFKCSLLFPPIHTSLLIEIFQYVPYVGTHTLSSTPNLVLVSTRSLLCCSSKPWFILWNIGSLQPYLASELLKEDKMTPSLHLCPIFRGIFYIGDSSIQAGKRGNKLAMVAIPLARTDGQTCIPSRSTRGCHHCDKGQDFDSDTPEFSSQSYISDQICDLIIVVLLLSSSSQLVQLKGGLLLN